MDISMPQHQRQGASLLPDAQQACLLVDGGPSRAVILRRSEEHTSELQSQSNLVCRLLLEQRKQLILNAKPDKTLYVLGEQVTLSLSALDVKEHPAPAIVMVSVVDKSVIPLAH